MKTLKVWMPMLVVAVAAATMIGCSEAPPKSADVTGSIRTSLDQAGLKDVSVKQDREKGVVTLGGHVPMDADKTQAASLAQSIAGNQVVANEIAVVPAVNASDAKQMNSELDKGIEANLTASLLKSKLNEGVKFDVKNHVVTLSGQVASQAKRAEVEKVAAAVLNVQQVVNELQVKDQKASSSSN